MNTPNPALMSLYHTEHVYEEKLADFPSLLARISWGIHRADNSVERSNEVERQKQEAEELTEAIREVESLRMEQPRRTMRHTRAPAILPSSMASMVPVGFDEGMVRMASIASDVGTTLAGLEKEAGIGSLAQAVTKGAKGIVGGLGKTVGGNITGQVGKALSQAPTKVLKPVTGLSTTGAVAAKTPNFSNAGHITPAQAYYASAGKNPTMAAGNYSHQMYQMQPAHVRSAVENSTLVRAGMPPHIAADLARMSSKPGEDIASAVKRESGIAAARKTTVSSPPAAQSVAKNPSLSGGVSTPPAPVVKPPINGQLNAAPAVAQASATPWQPPSAPAPNLGSRYQGLDQGSKAKAYAAVEKAQGPQVQSPNYGGGSGGGNRGGGGPYRGPGQVEPPSPTPAPQTAPTGKEGPGFLERTGLFTPEGKFRTGKAMMGLGLLGAGYAGYQGIKGGLNYLSGHPQPYNYGGGGNVVPAGVNQYGYPQQGTPFYG